MSRPRRQIRVGSADLAVGERRIVEVEGRSIGIFNIDGNYYALHNRCPHMAGPLCEGPVTGTTLPTADGGFVYGMEGELVRCGWHGWEFEIKSGRCLISERIRAKSYRVTTEGGELILHV